MTHVRLVPKVIPIRSKELTKEKLITAVGRVLAQEGFKGIGVNAVAREAGVDKKLIYRYFHGLTNLVAAYGHSLEFWPSAEELVGDDLECIRHMGPGELMAEFFKRYLRAIRSRPQTLEIMAWEGVERNELTLQLEGVRVKTALEFFEHLGEDPPDEVDLTALVLIMAGAVHFLTTRSRNHRSIGGIDLQGEDGWRRIENTMELMLRKTLLTGEQASDKQQHAANR